MTAGWPASALDALSREVVLRGLGNLILLAAEFPAYEFGTQQTWNGVSLVAVCREGADRAGTYAVITSDPGEMRHVLTLGADPASTRKRATSKDAATRPTEEDIMTSHLTALDERQRELEHDNPNWKVWYVPHMDRTVTWCARPQPLLNAESPEQLQKLIDRAHDELRDDNAP